MQSSHLISIAALRAVALLCLLALLIGVAACQPAIQEPRPGEIFVSLHITGGIAGSDALITITGDGQVQRTGMPRRTLPGGALGAGELFKKLTATGVYDVKPGQYLPDNPCCDRQTYELTLTRSGRVFAFVTMDSTESAPEPIMRATGLIQQAAEAAK